MSARETEQGRKSISRAELLGLGRCGRPREFVAIAARALGQAPGDPALQFLFAANIAQLGLRTLASEALDALPEAAQATPDVRALREAVSRLPDDRVGSRERAATALGNLRALRVRGVDLSEQFAAWRERGDLDDCFRCADGNLVRRMRWAGAPHWTHFITDQRGAAARFVEQHMGAAEMFPRPFIIEGLDPPWLFDAAWRKLGRNRIGFAPPITIVQADPLELLDGLSALDLREQLVDPRVRVFVGADASQRWLNDALGRLDEVVLGSVVPLPVTRTRAVPSLETMIARARASQAEAFRRVQTRVEAAYRGRDAAWWAGRYAEALGGGKPLRVLVPTSRYSTYIKHAAEDWAGAFRRLGCDALVWMEKPGGRPSTVGHAEIIDRFQPDLIALINSFRGDNGLPYPAGVPWLCWVQDAMPHHFQERVWGELDFVAGHVHKEVREQRGFPRDRTLHFPVVASERKFHPGRADASLLGRFACEVAYVSHQSETPAQFHERSRREAGGGESGSLLDELRPLVEAEAADPVGASLYRRLSGAVDGVIARRGLGGGATYILRHYALPLADRVLRHQMLEWAARVCQRRGWRLRVYGRGWESHPTLSPFAGGELAHGEELRACYQAACVHLHGSVTTLVHQRVMECSLSGGLPLGRLTTDALSECTGWATREALLGAPASARIVEGERIGFRTAEAPALTAVAAQMRGLGMDFPETVWISPARAAAYSQADHPLSEGLHPWWLFGDLSGLTFRSADELETLVAGFVGAPERRAAASAAMAARVRERCTVEVFAGKVLEMIGGSLARAQRTHGERDSRAA
ncbi:MAG TPA: hypothetical protein VFF69_04615 [Phycisphaerales bacterium]|nr:hypothetical protein [Phycisphaerales bacterium]